MVWRLTYTTIEFIIYVIVQVYAKIEVPTSYLVPIVFLRKQPIAECQTRLFTHSGNNWPTKHCHWSNRIKYNTHVRRYDPYFA